MKSCFMIFTVGLSLNALAFPKASEAEVTEFRRLYRECLEDNCDKNAFLSSRGSVSFSCEAYDKLRGFGPEIYELLYRESVKGEIARDVQADNKYSPRVIAIENERLLGNLWCMHTLQFSSKYTEVDFIWTDEPIALQWEGGSSIANERASFLVKEMRIAKHENRLVDARRAMGNLQIMGVFAFPTLFGELTQGCDDVIEILVDEEWPCNGAPTLNKDGLLKWWKDNSMRYELPRRSAKFKGSAHLEKWNRIEAKDRKIRVYDTQNSAAPIAVNTNLASRLTCIDMKNCLDSISVVGTNLYLKCLSSGVRYRCVFNEIAYGSRSNKYGEVLVLPEGSSLVMANGEIEFTFLPIASRSLGKRGFYLCLKRNDIEHGVGMKNGFLLFDPSADSSGTGGSSTATGCALECNLKGIVLKNSLADD